MRTSLRISCAVMAIVMAPAGASLAAENAGCDKLSGAARGACEAEMGKAKAAAAKEKGALQGRSEERRGIGPKEKGQGAERGKGLNDDPLRDKQDAGKAAMERAKEQAKTQAKPSVPK